MDLEQFKQYAIKAGSVSTPANTYLGDLNICKIKMMVLWDQRPTRAIPRFPSRINCIVFVFSSQTKQV